MKISIHFCIETAAEINKSLYLFQRVLIDDKNNNCKYTALRSNACIINNNVFVIN